MQHKFRFVNMIVFVLLFSFLLNMTVFAATPDEYSELERE